jgi:hypothetical protein
MDLIERYVAEVGRYLPARSDVPDELRSLLSDALEQRASEAGRPPDDDMAADVLREFGDPEEVAERYSQPRYLIGPELYPLYESIAIGIIVISLAIRVAVAVFRLLVDRRLPQLASFPGAAGEFILNTFVLLGVLTLVFFVLERVLPASRAESPWDPRDLPPQPGEARSHVSRRDVEISLWELTIGLILLNVFPQWIGIPFVQQYRPHLASPVELAIPLPVVLLNTYWMAALLLNILLWRACEWTRALRWMQLFVGLAGMAVVVTMLAGAGPVSAADHLGLARIVRGLLWAALFYQLWLGATRVWRLMHSPSVARTPSMTAL